MENKTASTSRGKLFDCVSVLWAMNANKSFFTFTLPSLENGTYQRDPLCSTTGDLEVGKMFSRTLEAWKRKEQRENPGLWGSGRNGGKSVGVRSTMINPYTAE